MLCAACEPCDTCQMDEPCGQMKGEVHPEVEVPDYLVEADYHFDLTDIPAPLLDTLRECDVCMSDLEDKLVQEDVVYGNTSEDRMYSEG